MALRAPSFQTFDPPAAIPPGGSEATDDAFMDFVRTACDDATRWAGWEVCNRWQLTNHLLKALDGNTPQPTLGRVPNWRHKIRWLGIEYRARPELVEAETRAYLLRQFHRGER